MGSPFTPIHSPQLHSHICYIWHKHSILQTTFPAHICHPVTWVSWGCRVREIFVIEFCHHHVEATLGVQQMSVRHINALVLISSFCAYFNVLSHLATPLLPNRKPQISHSYSPHPLQRAKREPSQTKIIQMNLAERNLSSTQVVTFIKNYY